MRPTDLTEQTTQLLDLVISGRHDEAARLYQTAARSLPEPLQTDLLTSTLAIATLRGKVLTLPPFIRGIAQRGLVTRSQIETVDQRLNAMMETVRARPDLNPDNPESLGRILATVAPSYPRSPDGATGR